MSWESTIEPDRVSLRIRLRTTAGPGRFQSSGSTSHRMMSYPNSSWIHRFSRSVIEQVGGTQRQPVDEMLNAPVIRRARASHDANNFVAFGQQQFGEV